MKGHGSGRLDLDLDGPPLARGHTVVENDERMRFRSDGQETQDEKTTRIELDIDG